MPDPSALEAAIAHLEAQRAALGDAAVDAAVLALRAQAAPAAAGAGTTAATATPSVASGSAAARLRQVSILFADIADSTTMLERVGAEDALALVSRALEGFARIVRAHGGEVLRFTGDGLKAAFGAERAREDDAERAVRAGLGIVEAAAEHAERVARPLGVARFGVRVGIHTGTVLLGAGVEADRSAMGHAVHLAARMEQSAPVGRLRISHDTWRQVRGALRCEAQPPLAVKGSEAPLVTYLVLGDDGHAERTVRRGIEGLPTPMVARDAELKSLLDLFARAAAGRHAALAVVAGEAGIGKSRLRRELLLRLAEAPQSRGASGASGASGSSDAPTAPTCLRVRAQPSGHLQAYGLLRQLLARWLGIADDLPPGQARARLVEGLAPWLGRDAQLRAGRVGQLVGFEFEGASAVQGLGGRSLRDQAFEALREALHAAAAHTPLLLVLEDLHWADEASLDFVQALARPAAVPLMLLLLGRPVWLERRPLPAIDEAAPDAAPLARLARLDILLEPLPKDAASALARLLLRPMAPASESLCRLLVQRSGGNPYFMEELVRMWMEDGTIDARTRPWRLGGGLAGRLETLRVPDTLVGVLQARLDALPPAELAALQHASIVGAVFWPSALAQLDAEAPQALPALVRRGLLVHRPTSAFDQAEEYAFQHHLLHEVTYGTLLKAARREGHARVARWLAARVAGRESEFVAITALHYERAGDSAQAFEYYDRARGLAEARFAHAEVLELTERALAQPVRLPPRRRFVLLQARHSTFDRLDRKDEAAAALRAMHDWAEQNDENVLRADVATARMLRADHEGRPDEAAACARLAIELASGRAETAAQAALTLAHGELAWLAVAGRDFDSAERHLAEGIACARRVARAPAEDGGYEGYEVQLRAIEIRALIAQERHAEVERAAHAGLARLDRMTRPMLHDRFVLLESLFEAQLLLGDVDAACATARQALERALEIGMPRFRAAALVHTAEAALAAGDRAAAHDAAQEAGRVARENDVPYVLPLVAECEGRLAEVRGDKAAARDAWHDAVRLYTAQGRAPEAWRLRCELAAMAVEAVAGGEGGVGGERGGGRAAACEEARAAIDAVLAEADADADAAGHAAADSLTADALWACLRVFDACGDARAGELLPRLAARFDAALAQAADEAARQRLREHVPHWAALRRRLAAADTAAGPAR
ncbi:MAG: AAA family ATPase [Betaproteobacteria bacterium]|nr:AAA family ATPase [Betaproteobacteria bacterium]